MVFSSHGTRVIGSCFTRIFPVNIVLIMDVVRSNFGEVFPQIEKALRQCDFVAIDTEFTGLASNENQRPSLFDNPSERYKKLKGTVDRFLVCQFGISAFVKSSEFANTYEAHTFNFHLFPTSFGQIDVRFLCQASSLEFLCLHNMDFNKFVYEGVPFLNSSQREELRELCLKDQVEVPMTFNKEIENKFIAPQCKKIESWLEEGKSDELMLGGDKNHESRNLKGASFLQFMLYQEIRRKFNKLECKVGCQGKLIVKKRSDERPPQDDKEQIEKLVRQACGFTRVFELLVELKKPLLGHNLLTDILFIYEKFNDTLPDNYNVFKSEIHKLFPYIFDTKHIAFTLNRHEFFKETGLFSKTNLEELHSSMSCHKGLYYVLYTPIIVLAKYTNKYNNSHSIHEAGYDAYISGYVFLRMAHMLTAMTIGSAMEGPLAFREYFEIIKKYGNCVNVSRSSVPYMNLAGDDPQSHRPSWLHVSRKHGQKRLTAGQILSELHQFGSLDVKVLDNQRAIVAITHSNTSKRILKALRRHKTLAVRQYYPLFDSPRSRTLTWAGGITVITLLFSGIAAIFYGRRSLSDSRA